MSSAGLICRLLPAAEVQAGKAADSAQGMAAETGTAADADRRPEARA
jgi:hypothetical protein